MSQLHEDLIAIRENQNLTAEDIFDRTRISVENIESIESGELFSSDRNKTYVRSFARTYAKALGIKDDDMVHALDLVEIGSYSGFLREAYLGTDTAASKETPDATDDEPESETVAEEPVTVKAKPPAEKKDKEKEVTAPGSPEVESADTDDAEPEPKKEKKVKAIRAKSSMSMASERRKIDWSETNKKILKSDKSRKPLFALIIILLLLAAIGGAIYYLLQDNSTGETIIIPEQEETVVPPDQTQPEVDRPALPTDTIDAPVAPDAADVAAAIPDTISIEVYAAFGNLEPFRVRSDTFENRRPYWVATGRAMRVKFVDEIHLYNHRDRMLILYNGRVINQFADEDLSEQRVTIRRSQFENDPSLESFTAAMPANVRPPVEVIDRPVIIN